MHPPISQPSPASPPVTPDTTPDTAPDTGPPVTPPAIPGAATGRVLIEARHLAVDLGGRRVLEDVSLAVRPGEIVTLVGPNGSGKSTLLRSLIGALEPAAGRVVRAPGLRIGYVPQALRLDATLPLTVARFLSLPVRRTRAETAAALTRAGLPDLGSRPMTALSGGQFQRVLLARALLEKPDLLLLDEPTQGLDQPGSADFYSQIEAVRGQLGCAVVMASHELHVVMSASDRVICLNGHICCEGTPAVVASAPEYRALFGTGTHGALALYRHEHDHAHHHGHNHGHGHGHGHEPGHTDAHDQGRADGHLDGRAEGRAEGHLDGQADEHGHSDARGHADADRGGRAGAVGQADRDARTQVDR